MRFFGEQPAQAQTTSVPPAVPSATSVATSTSTTQTASTAPASTTPASTTPASTTAPKISSQNSSADRTAAIAAYVGTIGLLGLVAYFIWRQKQSVSEAAAAESTPTGPTSQNDLLNIVKDAASQAGIPPEVLMGVVTAESNWNNAPNQYSAQCKCSCIASSACAIGIAQTLPETAKSMGVTGDLCNPANSTIAGARYLAYLYSMYGDWTTTIQGYHAGPGNIAKGNIGPKTVSYTATVLNNIQQIKDYGLAGKAGGTGRAYTYAHTAQLRPRLFGRMTS